MRVPLVLLAVALTAPLQAPLQGERRQASADVVAIANADFERASDPAPGAFGSCVSSWLFAEREGHYSLHSGVHADGTRYARVTSRREGGRADFMSPSLKLSQFTEYHVTVRVRKSGVQPLLAVHPTKSRRQVDLELVTGPDDEWFDAKATLVTGAKAERFRFTLGAVGEGYVAWDELVVTKGAVLGSADGTILLLDLNDRLPDWEAPEDYWMRRDIRRLYGYEVDVWNYRDIDEARLRALDPVAILLSPKMSAGTVAGKGKERTAARERARSVLREANVPMLGVCLGCQWLGLAEGTSLRRIGETGNVEVERLGDDPVFNGLPERYPCAQSHRWALESLPPRFKHLAKSETCDIQAMRRGSEVVYGFQGHFERGWTTVAPHGRTLLDNFVRLADPKCRTSVR